MHAPTNVPPDGAMPELDEPLVGPVRGPPPEKVGDWAQAALRQPHDYDRIPAEMTDIVVSRLFCAGLSLETALGLMGGHPAAGKVREAIGEVDLAIRDFRTALFDHHQP